MGTHCSFLWCKDSPKPKIYQYQQAIQTKAVQQVPIIYQEQEVIVSLQPSQSGSFHLGQKIQSLARGYLSRKHFYLTKMRSIPDLSKTSSIITQQDLQKQTIDSLEDLQNQLFASLDNIFGPLNLEYSLDDEVQVEYHPSLLLKNGAIYQGEWASADSKHGRGLLILPDKTRYQGYFVDNQIDLYGRIFYPDGSAYQGYFKKGLFHGKGVYKTSLGTIQTGKFRKGVMQGKGKEVSAQGVSYEGEFRGGKRNGMGVLLLSDGSQYEGEFSEGFIQGQGTFQWVNGKKYEGEWKLGKMNGLGKLEMSNGTVYVGEFLNDQKHGQGDFQWDTRRRYVGGWVNGHMHGNGEYHSILEGGKVVVKAGVWAKGKRVRWL